ncbi:MAG: hypothetical protein A2Y17_04575 [Clostridiales bacterium GWF2_38_85]|nr:MAG: hypothetical protein A2Y17_04575 [Clostridiales bacterium GWF2_38_85]HBL85447.1 hypothetical protein [Clostridiales bacterium]
MKHTIIASILIILIISVVIINIFYVRNVVDEAQEKLNTLPQTQQSFFDYDQGSEIISEIQKYWFDRESELSLFIHTEEIDIIVLLFSNLKIYYESKNFELYKVSLDQLIRLLQNIKEAELPSFKSIF